MLGTFFAIKWSITKMRHLWFSQILTNLSQENNAKEKKDIPYNLQWVPYEKKSLG